MKKTRIVAFLLAALMVCSLMLASCKKNDDPTNPDDGNNPNQPGTELELVTEGVAKYVIVRDYKAGGEVLQAVAQIVNAIKTFTGADIEVKECYNDREDENDVVTDNEILVGKTNRPESATALANKRSDDWVLGVYGKKLVVASPSDGGTMKAVTVFLNSYVYEQGNKFEVKNYVESNGKEGKLFSLTFKESDNQTKPGTYSYNLFEVFGARIDSFTIIYTKTPVNTDAFAKRLQAYISKETGFELDVKKDARCYADYEILVGPTDRTDEELVKQLGDDDWLIRLRQTDTGAQMIILYGKNAEDAAYEAFTKRVMPVSKTPIDTSITAPFEYKN